MNLGTLTGGTIESVGPRIGDQPSAKWAAVVDDSVIWMPSRLVRVAVLVAQAEVPNGFVLVRDHNSPNDVVLPADGQVDLAEGNVFYRLERCNVEARGACLDQAKLAFVVNDRFEVSTRADQTGRTLRDLFGLPSHVRLFRDLESPNDQEVPAAAVASFIDGPVFYSREVQAELKITVNSRVFTEHNGVRPEMTGLQVAALVYPENPKNTRIHLVSNGNREVGLTETLHIRGCEVFDVVRKEVTGGFDLSRVTRELDELRAGGLAVTLVESPRLVIYHGLQLVPGAPVEQTDVLVPVPGAYPGQMLDLVFLPENSPLIGRVKGQPQEPRVRALGRTWRQISYHPHNGGGGPAWNPTVHGFHTYLGEVISWLRNI